MKQFTVKWKMSQQFGRIRCCFRKLDELTKKSWMNSFAALWTNSDYIHSEFYFVDDGVTVTVDAVKPVSFIPFGNPNYSNTKKWECYEITLPVDSYIAAYNFCLSQEGKPFDKSGIFCFGCFKACTRAPRGSSWICSRLMCEALKRAGVLSNRIDIYQVSPSALRELILTQKNYEVKMVQNWT